MSYYWQTSREVRAAEEGRPGFTVLRHDRGGNGDRGFLYAHKQILMTDDAASALAAQLTPPDFVRLKEDSSSLAELHLQLFEWTPAEVTAPERLPNLVISLQNSARSTNPNGRCDVSLNYVLTGEKTTIPHGGPAKPPIPSTPVAPPSFNADLPFVAVIDTGLAPTTVTGATGRVIASADDIDHLLAPTAGGPVTYLGAEAGHGTFIAWLIDKMSGGSVGVVASGALDPDGYGTVDRLIDALYRLRTDLPLHHSFPMGGPNVGVLNMSLGGFTDDAVELPVDQRGAMPLGLGEALDLWFADAPDSVVVAAAGNDAVNDRRFWPAARSATQRAVVAVGSLDDELVRSTFSNTGDWVAVSTLGEGIHSDYPAGTYPVSPHVSETFISGARWSGTSFAAPIVAAEIASRALQQHVTAFEAYLGFAQQLAGQELPGSGLVWDPRAKGPEFDPRV